MYGWLGALALGVLGLLYAEHRRLPGLKALTKLTASTAFVGLAWNQGATQSAYGIAVLVALALSWIGDACLLSPKARIFMGGIAAFLLGHVAFAAAFLLLGVKLSWVLGAGVPIGLFALAIHGWLGPKVEEGFKTPVKAYMLVITAMASLGFGCFGNGHTWLIPAGATAFFLSDITVAMDRFVEERFINRLVGLPLYFGAQALLALSVAG